MKSLLSALSLLLVVGLFVQCKKDDPSSNTPNTIQITSNTRDLQVPAGFNFETTEKVALQLNLDQPPLPGKYLLKVYADNPSVNLSPIYQAFIDQSQALNSTIQVPASGDKLYLTLQSPDGSGFLTILPKTATVNHTFYSGKRSNKTTVVGSPDCNFGCDVTRTHSGWWNAVKSPSNETVYCVTGTYNGGGISISDKSIVRLCGTGTISHISITSGVLQILDGADVTVDNLSLNSSNNNGLVIYDGGSLTVTGWFSPNADVVNYGDFSVHAFNLNSNAELENHGTFHITSNNSSTFNSNTVNYGTIIAEGNVNINNGADFENYCGAYFNADLMLNGDIENHSYISIDGLTSINSGAKFKLEDGAMAETNDLTINGFIEGDGSTSLFKVANLSNGNNGAKIRDNVEFCDENGIENLPGNIFSGGAVASCSLVIPTDACNPVGNGVPTIADADGDGVADNLDAFPNDPLRAAKSYFPGENSFGTLAFEDLWPAYGDYDFNDLVIDYRYEHILNANNDVVDLNADFVTRAIGGVLKNGFGFQLQVADAQIAQVSGTEYYNGIISTNGNGTEAGQSLATIIVFDDATKVLPNSTGSAFVNTVSSNPSQDPDSLRIQIQFANAQPMINLGEAPYNPFIFIAQNRGRELHLAGQAPTDLADPAFFGSLDDNTDPNSSNTYKSDTHLPWAIHVVNGFNYPEEKVDISETYQYFSIWAQTAGQSYTDWFEDQPGYVSLNKLYQNQ